MGREKLSGKMVGFMKESTGMIKKMGREFISKLNGFNSFRWADGRVYDGQWLQGKQHGEGYYTNRDRLRRRGYWEQGNRVKWLDE